jgi:hypothetical protein
MKHALVCLLAILASVSCATPQQYGNPALLDFINDGETSRTNVILSLGQPSATFEDEHILTYRIGGSRETGYFVRDAPGTWYETSFSLVLVFDADGTLQSHSMVKVR